MWQHMTASCFRFPRQTFRMRLHVEARLFFIFQTLPLTTNVVPVIQLCGKAQNRSGQTRVG